MDVSLITSLYRSEQFLTHFVDHLLRVSGEVSQAGLTLESIIVANDPTSAELEQINRLITSAGTALSVKLLQVPRETLYASWSRAMEVATGALIGIWNVDDIRNSAALLEGHQLKQGGCHLIDFSYKLEMTFKQLYGRPVQISFENPAVPYMQSRAGTVDWCRASPFFLFSAELYQQTGRFDGRFRIVGDFDWQSRAVKFASYCIGTSSGGTFYVHGNNLSMWTHQDTPIEENVVRLLHREWGNLQPTDPNMMRETWAKWDDDTLPPDVQETLWGRAAWVNYRKWKRSQFFRDLSIAVRTLGSEIVDRTGTRRVLAKLGLVSSTTHVSIS